jgi:hypothetical protein
MPEYGYLHLGKVLNRDPVTGAYFLESVGLARTQKWGPCASTVAGLQKGDRVVLGATGTSRDPLTILGKIGAGPLTIDQVQGLLAALEDKASVVAVESLAAQLAELDGAVDARLDAVEGRATALEGRATALEGRATTAEGRLTAVENRVTALEGKKVSGGGWYVAETYECPGTILDNCDRMPFAGQLWKVGNDLTLAPDNKHWIINKAGIWRPSFAPRWTAPIRYPSGTAGEGTDRSFHIGVTARQFGPSNCTFETGVGNWTITAAAGAIAPSTTQKHSGTQSMRVTPSGTSVNVGVLSDHIAVVPGQKVTCTTWVWFTTAVTGNYSSAVNWYDASGVYLSTSQTPLSIPAATWTPVIQTFGAPPGAFFADAVPLLGGTPAASNVFYVDDVSIGPSINDSSMFLFEESWNEVNTGNQHNQTKKLGSDLLLGVGDRVCLFSYWGGTPLTDRLVFPASSNRMSMTYVGPV